MDVFLLALLGTAGILTLVIRPGRSSSGPSRSARRAFGRAEALAQAVARLSDLEKLCHGAHTVCRLHGRLGAMSVVLRISATEAHACQAHLEVTGGLFLPPGATIRSELGPLRGRMALSGALECEPWASWKRSARHVVRPSREALHPGWSELLDRFAPGEVQLSVEPECFCLHTNVTDAEELVDILGDITQQLTAITRPGVYR